MPLTHGAIVALSPRSCVQVTATMHMRGKIDLRPIFDGESKKLQ